MRYMETARLWMVAVMVAGIIGPTVASDQAWGADLPEVQQVQNEAAKGASGPSILFIGYRHGTTTGGATQRHFLRDLVQKHGFRVAYREQEFAYVNRPGNVDPAEFENYDVLVYLDPAWMPAEEGCLSETFAKQWAAAVEFVEKGGGLLFMPSVGESYRFSAQRCFEGLGLDLLAGIPVDAEGVAATVMEIRWSYTDRFDRQHPVMEDIRGLWVPAYRPEDREVWNANSVPFRVSGDWQVLARYGASVQVKPFEFHGPGRQLPTPTDADREAAPLLAVREFGQGRMGFFGVHSAYHIVGGRAPAYEDIFFNKGLKGHPSDGERLIVNLLNWLAEKALKNPDLGGAPTEPDAIARPEFKAVPPFEKPQDFAAQRPGFRGVIGALSPRSGGQSSVADYAAKARELGFDFLVVLDDLEKVNGELYQQLNAEAKAATTDDFVCIPGLRFRDEVGNRFVAFRHGLSFPTKVMLRENKRFTTLIREGERSSGTAGLGIAKWYQANEGRMAICFYRDSRDRESDDPYEYGVPPWDIRPYRSFHSVFTYDADGRLMDDMVEEHKVVVDDGQHPHPVAITFLKRAEDLQMVADGRLPHTVWWANELARLARRTDDAEPTHSAYLANTYATEGPRITRWQFDSRDLVSNGEYWDWTQYYQRWAMGVESDVGLDTVEVWDGKDLIRRYHPNGARRFDRVLVVNKHQLTMPFLIATDLNGKRAVTAGLRWRSHNFYVSWCGDRVNTLCYSALPCPRRSRHGARRPALILCRFSLRGRFGTTSGSMSTLMSFGSRASTVRRSAARGSGRASALIRRRGSRVTAASTATSPGPWPARRRSSRNRSSSTSCSRSRRARTPGPPAGPLSRRTCRTGSCDTRRSLITAIGPRRCWSRRSSPSSRTCERTRSHIRSMSPASAALRLMPVTARWRSSAPASAIARTPCSMTTGIGSM